MGWRSYLLLLIVAVVSYELGGARWCAVAVGWSLFCRLAPRLACMLCFAPIGGLLGFVAGAVLFILIQIPLGEATLFVTLFLFIKAPAVLNAITVFAYIVWGACCLASLYVGGGFGWEWCWGDWYR